jgi:hypothetical protein
MRMLKKRGASSVDPSAPLHPLTSVPLIIVPRMNTQRSNILAYIALFIGIYIVPMAFATLFRVHGIAALLVSHGATAVQVLMVMYFVVKRDRRASWTGAVTTASIVLLNNAGAWFVL